MRAAILRRAGARVGRRVVIGPGVRVLGPAGLSLSDGVGVARDAVLDARAGLDLRHGALVGFEALLLTWTHRSDKPDVPIANQGFAGEPLTIGARSWIGARAVVLPGASVEPGAVVGAGAVLTRPVRAGTVVGGNPARHIRDR